MDDEACGLVDHHELLVLIAHVEGHLLGHDGRVVVGPVEHQRDDVARAHLIVALDGAVVDKEESGLGRLLDAVARGVLCVLGQVLVDAQGHLSAVDLEPQMLKERLRLAVRLRLSVIVEQLFQLVVEQFVVSHVHHSSSVTSRKSSTSSTSSPVLMNPLSTRLSVMRSSSSVE